eukprot:gene10457-2979_t
MGNSKGLEAIKKLNGMEITNEDMENIFNTYDKNKDGLLQREEASNFLKEVLTFYSKKAKEEFKKVKEEQGGIVTLEDEQKFNDACDVEKNIKEYQVSMFKLIDTDSNGTIDKEEFKKWFKTYSKEKLGL